MKKVSHVNKKFIIYSFCFVVALFLLFSFFVTGKMLRRYGQLSQNGWAEIEEFTVREAKKNHYQIWASGTFTYQGERYIVTAPTLFNYPNPWAAQTKITEMNKEGKVRMQVWFSPTPNKIQEALFIRVFPFYSVLSTSILAGILLYFCGIALYFHKKGYGE